MRNITINLRISFDLVPHNLLCDKLLRYGCDDITLKWFKSYLKDRYQYVKCDNSISNIKKIGDLSVPQGSILGPLLFIIYMNDIVNLPLNGNITLFADDITLIYEAKNYKELEMHMNDDMKSISSWLMANKLVINIDKSNFMIMGRPLKKHEFKRILQQSSSEESQ